MAGCLQDELSIKPTVILLLEVNKEPHTNQLVILFPLFVFPFGHPSVHNVPLQPFMHLFFLKKKDSSLLFSNSI